MKTQDGISKSVMFYSYSKSRDTNVTCSVGSWETSDYFCCCGRWRCVLTADWLTRTNRLLAKSMDGYDWLALPARYLMRDISYLINLKVILGI